MDSSEQEVVAGHHGHELQSCRHCLLCLLKCFLDARIHLGGVGTWCSEYQEERTRAVLDIRGEVVAHGTNLHFCHVVEVQYAATTCAQHDVVELLDSLQRTLVLHGVLVGVS